MSKRSSEYNNGRVTVAEGYTGLGRRGLPLVLPICGGGGLVDSSAIHATQRGRVEQAVSEGEARCEAVAGKQEARGSREAEDAYER